MGVKFSSSLWGAVAIVWAIAASPALADDLIQPDWRGDPGTTHQQWTFDDDDNPAAPEIMDNPYITGLPPGTQAAIVKKEHSDGWYPDILGRDGVWGDLESITIDIDNRPDPLDYKEIWIQITYYLPPNNEPIVNVPGALYLDGETRQLEPLALGFWYLQQGMWRIEPNPDHEVIEITTGSMGMTIDQIVVDTIVVPPCNDPFADADFDGDVDQEDFGLWQVCWTGPGGGVPTGCECFDRDNDGAGDGDVDQDDFDAFQACASGPTIPADATCDD